MRWWRHGDNLLNLKSQNGVFEESLGADLGKTEEPLGALSTVVRCYILHLLQVLELSSERGKRDSFSYSTQL
jgi:hypothetical protein